MSPTILRIDGFRFYFNSREELRPHVHVQTADGEAKFWLEPIVSLADDWGLKTATLRRLQTLVEEHQDEFSHAWKRHFESIR